MIRTILNALTADEIEEITGILNGTTNYMMTRMSNDGSEFAEVLKDAQEKGYAEKDPTADIEGYDACRKIAILTSLVCGQQVDFHDIHTEGITKVSAADMKYAAQMRRVIKLLASSKKTEEGYAVLVAPFLLSKEHPLYNVNDVFNAVFVHGNVLGDAMFYGSGAGKLPTASAVVADMVDIARHMDGNIPMEWKAEKRTLAEFGKMKHAFFVRTVSDKSAVQRLFGEVEYVDAGIEGEIGFLTSAMTEEAFAIKASELTVRSVIRIGR